MLIQLVGPQACGKTELRRRLCPDAVNIGSSLRSMFNAEMIDAPGYWFEETVLTARMLARLENWMSSTWIDVEIMGHPSELIHNPGIWLYEGLRPIAVEPTMIWEVNQRSL